MSGKNDTTVPRPAKMPSTTSERSASLIWADSIAASAASESEVMPCVMRSWKNAPIQLKVMKKTAAMMRTNEGIAVHLPVRIRSILRLRSCSLLSRGLTTVCDTTRPMNE